MPFSEPSIYDRTEAIFGAHTDETGSNRILDDIPRKKTGIIAFAKDAIVKSRLPFEFAPCRMHRTANLIFEGADKRGKPESWLAGPQEQVHVVWHHTIGEQPISEPFAILHEPRPSIFGGEADSKYGHPVPHCNRNKICT